MTTRQIPLLIEASQVHAGHFLGNKGEPPADNSMAVEGKGYRQRREDLER